MKTLEKIWWGSLVVAMLGIVAFWVFGFNNQLNASAISFFSAGIAGFVALAAKGLQALRACHCPY